uniref:Receptor-like serine/threonine-protein kinase n=1 Tax=Fagus sylvatica TaxID=28930 RepID=A0A2N9G9F2_FAGSY
MEALFLFLLLSAFFTAEAVNRGSSLTPTTNQSWASPSGQYAFGFYKEGDGFAVGIFLAKIPQKTVVWTANRDNAPVPADVTLNFTSDGRMVLQSAQGTEITKVVNFVGAATSAASASMLDTGNFVLYDSDNQTILWESFKNPTDTILPTQQLSADGQDKYVLVSSVSESNHSTGLFRALMQQDGYLALYPIRTPYTIQYGYWSKRGPLLSATLNLGVDGHLYLASDNNTVTISAAKNSTKGVLYLLRMDADGFLRLYSHNMDQNGTWSVTWFSEFDKCVPKGLCGFNAYCVEVKDAFGCNCLPGFVFVDSNKTSAGCTRNFTVEICKEKYQTYPMEAVANITWENQTDSVTLLTSAQTDCQNACSQDCNCEAALFQDGACSKQRLPLRFGQRTEGNSNVALIKVLTSSFEIWQRTSNVALIKVLTSTLLQIKLCQKKEKERKRSRVENTSSNKKIVLSDEDVGPRSFTYAELERVTDNFKEELGRGAFGIVYKGAIGNGKKFVAVKKLEKFLVDREREFQAEMKVIGRTHHKNLICLLGYCHDGSNRLLVYEYMSNGSLADILFTPGNKPCWDERIEIAYNVAKGILYLHEDCVPQIIHCDIKPQNILMDENMCAKISDFGLAKLLKSDQTKTLTGIRGTRGYVAPEWLRKVSHVTVKVDVYSFGIVLLEIICCRKSVDSDLPENEAILEEWTYDCFERGELSKLVNDEKVDNRQLERMVKVALWCILDDPSLRPSMKKVLLMLEGTMDIPIPPNPTYVLSVT